MRRPTVSASLTPALRDAVRRAALIEGRSISELVEDAIARYFSTAHREAEHHAIIAKLQRISQHLNALERGLETQFELICHATRFTMSVAPEIPEQDRAVLNARGSERFRNVVATVVGRLGAGRSVWRDSFAASEQQPAPSTEANSAVQTPTPDVAKNQGD